MLNADEGMKKDFVGRGIEPSVTHVQPIDTASIPNLLFLHRPQLLFTGMSQVHGAGFPAIGKAWGGARVGS